MSFVAGIKWRKEGWSEHNPVFKILKKIWIVFEPILFALIGTEIQVRKILVIKMLVSRTYTIYY